MFSDSGLIDELHSALEMSRGLAEPGGMVGYGVAELRRESGELIRVPFTNLITDYGDQYNARKLIVGVSPANAAAPTAASGMQIGSGSTAVAKAGAGAAMVTLLAGVAFDSTYPQVVDLGSGLGWNAVYRATFPAGTGTGTIAEATITNGAVGTASTSGNTISRALLSITKAAGDSLTLTWNHKQLGA